jgi:hypothetical protein
MAKESLATIGKEAKDFLTSLPLLTKNLIFDDPVDHYYQTDPQNESDKSETPNNNVAPEAAPEYTDPSISGWLYKRSR